LPLLRVESGTLGTTVRVTAGDSLALKPGNVQNLVARPDQGIVGREWVYTTDKPGAYFGTFATSAAATDADLHLLTFAEVRGRQLVFVSTLEGTVRQGELRHLTLTLRNWDGGDVQLDADDVLRKRDQRIGSTGRSWALDLKPGVNRHYRLTLTGSVPLGSAGEIHMPDVRVDAPGNVRVQRCLAVCGPELATEAIGGLQAAADGPDALRSWPRDAERLRRAGGSAWRVTSDDWRMLLRLRSGGTRPTPVQLLLTEHAASVADGHRWIHQATYWLYHEAGADLNITLPEGAAVLAVAIDGVSVPPLQPGPDRVWLPLPGGAGGRAVRLSWAFAEGKEPITAPLLEGPRVAGVSAGPVVWTLHVPEGYRAGMGWTRSGRGVERSSAAALDLWRATAQLRLATRMVERSRDEGAP
jgi:hypothetical protein